MADDLELPSRAQRLRPSTTPHGPRNRTRSTAALDPSSPVRTRVNSPESVPPSPNPEFLPAVIETPPTSSPSPPPAVRSVAAKPPPLTIPSATSFESVLVQWKPLPLEAALCTYINNCHALTALTGVHQGHSLRKSFNTSSHAQFGLRQVNRRSGSSPLKI